MSVRVEDVALTVLVLALVAALGASVYVGIYLYGSS